MQEINLESLMDVLKPVVSSVLGNMFSHILHPTAIWISLDWVWSCISDLQNTWRASFWSLRCFLFLLYILPSRVLLDFLLVFKWIIASESLGVSGLMDYKGALYLTTLGSIGRGLNFSRLICLIYIGSTDCAKTQIGENITFLCQEGKIGSILQYGRVLKNYNESCELMSNV